MLKLFSRLALGAGLLTAFAWARSTGAPIRRSGVPGEGVCADCHASFPLNSGTGSLKVKLLDANGWLPGQQYRLRITLTDPDARRWGFQITPRLASDTTKPAGTLAVAQPERTQLQNDNGIQSITHTQPGTNAGTAGGNTWEILWTAPADISVGDIKFFVAGNAANNNGNNQGDRIYTTTLTLSPIASIPTVTRYLPMFVFGENWNSAIFANNTTAHSFPLKVAFRGDDGSPMPGLPIPGSVIEDTMDGRNNGSLDTQGIDAPLTKGYVVLTAPDWMSAFGFIRVNVPDQAAAETPVAFTTAMTACTFPFDDTKVDTLLSIVNASDSETRLTLTVRSEDGSVVGTSPLVVAGNARVDFKLKDRQGLEMVSGSTGSIDIDAITGSFAAGAFRMGQKTISSIPITERQ